MIMIVALVIIADFKHAGSIVIKYFFRFTRHSKKSPTMKAYNTPIAADSVAVAIPKTTEPTTKMGMIRAKMERFVR